MEKDKRMRLMLNREKNPEESATGGMKVS